MLFCGEPFARNHRQAITGLGSECGSLNTVLTAHWDASHLIKKVGSIIAFQFILSDLL